MKLFGTDGIRGIFGEGVFEIDNLKRLAYSISSWIKANIQKKSKFYEQEIVLIGRDTRVSGKRIGKILTDVFRDNGLEVVLLGILPTPIISYFARIIKPVQAIAITASHNPPQYNGIKIMDNDGLKISEEDEEEIEKIYDRCIFATKARANTIKSKSVYNKKLHKVLQPYQQNCSLRLLKNYLQNAIDEIGRIEYSNGRQLRIILDCANGSTYKIAPYLFEHLGFKNLKVINNNSNGNDINVDCSVVNIDKTVGRLRRERAEFDFLISFDGDGDRVFVVDGKFNIYDGDALLAIFTYYYTVIKKEKLRSIVGTIMSNSGLERFCRRLSVGFVRAPVGDRNVALKILEEQTFLGGESSGHIVNLKINSYGDGILNAFLFAKIYSETPQILTETMKEYKPFDSYLLNLQVRNKIPLENLKNFKSQIDKYNKYASMDVRVVVRYSGTEDLLRIFVESKEKGEGRRIAEELRNIYLKECKLGAGYET